jgi:hypothetical protein
MLLGSWWRVLLLGTTNAGREGRLSYMRPRIAPLVSPNATKTGQEPSPGPRSPGLVPPRAYASRRTAGDTTASARDSGRATTPTASPLPWTSRVASHRSSFQHSRRHFPQWAEPALFRQHNRGIAGSSGYSSRKLPGPTWMTEIPAPRALWRLLAASLLLALILVAHSTMTGRRLLTTQWAAADRLSTGATALPRSLMIEACAGDPVFSRQRRQPMRIANTIVYVALAVSLIGGFMVRATAQPAGDKADHIMVTPDAVKWVDTPPSLPAGAKWAVLEGDPPQAGPLDVVAPTGDPDLT